MCYKLNHIDNNFFARILTKNEQENILCHYVKTSVGKQRAVGQHTKQNPNNAYPTKPLAVYQVFLLNPICRLTIYGQCSPFKYTFIVPTF